MARTFDRGRLISGAAVAIIHALLAYAFLLGLIGRPITRAEQELKLFDISVPPPPPRERKPPVAPRRAKARGAAAPRNLKAKATEIVTPPPAVPLIFPPPIVTARQAGTGAAPSAGASERRGPGTGAGGSGEGTGSGDYGDGDGDGDGGTPPRHVAGRIKNSDFPRALMREGARDSVSVGVRFRVGVDGRVMWCVATKSSGHLEVDELTCRLIKDRFRFKPERDKNGRKVPSIIVETETWVIERDPDYDGADGH